MYYARLFMRLYLQSLLQVESKVRCSVSEAEYSQGTSYNEYGSQGQPIEPGFFLFFRHIFFFLFDFLVWKSW